MCLHTRAVQSAERCMERGRFSRAVKYPLPADRGVRVHHFAAAAALCRWPCGVPGHHGAQGAHPIPCTSWQPARLRDAPCKLPDSEPQMAVPCVMLVQLSHACNFTYHRQRLGQEHWAEQQQYREHPDAGVKTLLDSLDLTDPENPETLLCRTGGAGRVAGGQAGESAARLCSGDGATAVRAALLLPGVAAAVRHHAARRGECQAECCAQCCASSDHAQADVQAQLSVSSVSAVGYCRLHTNTGSCTLRGARLHLNLRQAGRLNRRASTRSCSPAAAESSKGCRPATLLWHIKFQTMSRGAGRSAL